MMHDIQSSSLNYLPARLLSKLQVAKQDQFCSRQVASCLWVASCQAKLPPSYLQIASCQANRKLSCNLPASCQLKLSTIGGTGDQELCSWFFLFMDVRGWKSQGLDFSLNASPIKYFLYLYLNVCSTASRLAISCWLVKSIIRKHFLNWLSVEKLDEDRNKKIYFVSFRLHLVTFVRPTD